MVGLLLNVFCKRKHIPLLKEMDISETRTGLFGLWVKMFILLFNIFYFYLTIKKTFREIKVLLVSVLKLLISQYVVLTVILQHMKNI